MAKYLVTQLARLGDIIQSKRLILSLKSEADLHLLVDNNLVELAKIIYPFAKIHGIYLHNVSCVSMFEHNLKLFKILKNENFDKIYPLNFSIFSQRINTLFDPEKLQGFSRNTTYDRHSLWVKMAFRWMKDRKNTPLNLMDYWAYFAEKPISAHLVNPIAKAKGNGLGVVVAGQNLRRSLTPKNYAKIIQIHYEKILQEYGNNQPLFLFGTKFEEKLAKEIINFLPTKFKNIQNLTGKTSLITLIDYIKDLNLLLSPDTGLAHLAAHFGVLVEAYYFSSANCFETGPYGIGHRVWQANCNCSPCNEQQKCIYNKNNDFSELPCHKPFHSQGFLMHLEPEKYIKSSLEKNPLVNLSLYHSSFLEDKSELNQLPKCDYNYLDEEKYYFGLNWFDLVKQELEQINNRRENLRKILKNYCISNKNIPLEHSVLTDNFHQESDWIFPPLFG